VLKTVTSPIMRAVRFITPRFIPDRHIGIAAFFLVAGLWLALTMLKIQLVLEARQLVN
jgi:hypothetical protein